MKRFYQTILFFLFASLTFACGAENRAPLQTPLDTLKAYNQAIKEKDTAAMKSLLSKGSIKMALEEAKVQNVPVEEVLGKETLYSPGQTTVKIKNQKIEGESATIEVENSFGTWDVVPFVREDGKWKIAKERYADELMKQAEEDNKRFDEQMKRERNP